MYSRDIFLLLSIVNSLIPISVQQQDQGIETNRIGGDSGDAPGHLSTVLVDLGKLLVDACPPLQCTGEDCVLATERNGCTVCACPIGSPARGCDPMPFVLWHELMTKGCPNATLPNKRDPAQRVHRYFRRINRFEHSDECESYVFPYCPDLDYNLWRSPRTKQECQKYCYNEKQNKVNTRPQQNKLP